MPSDPLAIITEGWAAVSDTWRELSASLAYLTLRQPSLRQPAVSGFVARVIYISEIAERLQGEFTWPAVRETLPLLEQLRAETADTAAAGRDLARTFPDKGLRQLVDVTDRASLRLDDFVRLSRPWLQSTIAEALASEGRGVGTMALGGPVDSGTTS